MAESAEKKKKPRSPRNTDDTHREKKDKSHKDLYAQILAGPPKAYGAEYYPYGLLSF